MLVLSGRDLTGLLPALQIIAAVESALRARQADRVLMPKRLHMHWDSNTLLAMPVAAECGLGVKLVSVVPGNAARGLPVTNGLMVLSDSETGLPLALMNAGALTAQRTGAVGAIGVKYLTPRHSSSIGIVGCGVQGAWQAIFACAVRPISDIFVFSRSMTSYERFASTVGHHAPGAHLRSCRSVHELLESTNVVITATTSSEPVLPDDPDLLANKHYISVGSYRPTMQELPDSVYRLSKVLVVDTEHARHEVGDVINPLRRGILGEMDVCSVGECVTGTRTVETARTTVYKSVGAAIFDLFVAHALYAAAKTQGLGREVDL